MRRTLPLAVLVVVLALSCTSSRSDFRYVVTSDPAAVSTCDLRGHTVIDRGNEPELRFRSHVRQLGGNVVLLTESTPLADTRIPQAGAQGLPHTYTAESADVYLCSSAIFEALAHSKRRL